MIQDAEYGQLCSDMPGSDNSEVQEGISQSNPVRLIIQRTPLLAYELARKGVVDVINLNKCDVDWAPFMSAEHFRYTLIRWSIEISRGDTEKLDALYTLTSRQPLPSLSNQQMYLYATDYGLGKLPLPPIYKQKVGDAGIASVSMEEYMIRFLVCSPLFDDAIVYDGNGSGTIRMTAFVDGARLDEFTMSSGVSCFFKFPGLGRLSSCRQMMIISKTAVKYGKNKDCQRNVSTSTEDYMNVLLADIAPFIRKFDSADTSPPFHMTACYHGNIIDIGVELRALLGDYPQQARYVNTRNMYCPFCWYQPFKGGARGFGGENSLKEFSQEKKRLLMAWEQV